MSSGVTGDWDKLRKLVNNMKRLVHLDERTAELAAVPLSALSRRTFDAQLTPYGEPWTHMYKHGGGVVRLVRSGKLRQSVTTFRPAGRQLQATGVKYSRYHDPPSFVPGRATDKLPQTWQQLLEEKAEQALRDIIEKG